MKKLPILLVSLFLVIFLSACGNDAVENPETKVKSDTPVVSAPVDSKDNQGNAEPSGSDTGSAPSGNNSGSTSNEGSPHDFSGFSKDGQFSGGAEVKEYNLSSVRRGPHPTLTRLIFSFAVGSEGTESAVEPPKYDITYTDAENKITAVFKGVKYNSLADKVEELKQLAPIVQDVQFSLKGDQMTMSLILVEKVSYQVFSLSSPARIAIVMSPDTNQQ